MRGHRVAVADVCAVQGGAWDSGDAACVDDSRGVGRERDTGMVGGLGRVEHVAKAEPSRDRVGISDSARVEPWACVLHGEGADNTDRMRGDRVEVRDICEVQGGAWGSGDAARGDYGRGAGRERDTGMVCGLGRSEHGAQTEPGRDRVGISDSAWVEPCGYSCHGDGPVRTDGM